VLSSVLHSQSSLNQGKTGPSEWLGKLDHLTLVIMPHVCIRNQHCVFSKLMGEGFPCLFPWGNPRNQLTFNLNLHKIIALVGEWLHMIFNNFFYLAVHYPSFLTGKQFNLVNYLWQ
jgi:hypothetical protein